MKKLIIILGVLFMSFYTFSQINAKLMKYPDVSDSQITFVYGGDIWLVDKNGGTAVQVTHSPGEESWPKFSPDGKSIAFTGRYNGNWDVYTMPVVGGMPTRITYQSHYDRMIEWHPEGNKLLFASARESGRQSYRQFYLVNKTGGFPTKLKIPYGELAAFSPDGSQLAYITKITENYPFKRYRGGLSSDILIYDFKTTKVENITNSHAIDGKPAWIGDKVYFLSDQAENMRLNLWYYDTKTKKTASVTNFDDFDISFMSAGNKEIVFEVGGKLYLMNAETHDYKEIKINVITDLTVEIARTKNVSKQIINMSASPEGKRIVFEARGELFNIPVKEGFVWNMTQSSGAFDQNPAWSPDGKSIAYWSDKSGEYEIYIQASDRKTSAKKLTSRGKGFGYRLNWSPDSKKIAYIDETNTIYIIDVNTGDKVKLAKTLWNVGHGGRNYFTISWSPDSKFLTFATALENGNSAVYIYDITGKKLNQITSGFYNDDSPIFSVDGKYLFYLTNRNMSAAYSDMGDGTWVYPNSTQIASISLTKKIPSLLAVKNDDMTKKESKDKDSKDSKKKESEKSDKVKVEIDFDNLESRLVILPPKAGNIAALYSFKDKLVYLRYPNTGSGSRSSSLILYDLKKREEKPIISNIRRPVLTADGKVFLVSSKGKYGIIKPMPKQKIDKPIPTNGLVMNLIPKEEWKQIFNDTWRRYRDFFYDPDMHKVDWNELKNRYGALLNDARTRWDVSNLQSNLAAELSAGHTYTFGGDVESMPSTNTGYLGIDWAFTNNKYQIKRIVKPADWDTKVRSPFDRPGVDVKAGYYILSVNGIALDPTKDPYAAFEGLSSKTILLSVSKTGAIKDAKEVIVKTLSVREEINLRYLEWIENNRKLVDKLSGGKLGYVYMSNTSGQGQLELVSMYYGQIDKKGFIIDERFNGGGQLADRFLELLQRPVVYNLHWRHGKDHQFPTKTNTGPVGMLINGWAGSGGDGLPWAFQELKAGPIVGERTLGILVGPATGHSLIDGGGITVPGARLYDNDGHWFWEGEGVSPDIEVWDDPNILMSGRDPQVERVVKEVLELLKTNPPRYTPAPQPEDRTSKGLNKK